MASPAWATGLALGSGGGCASPELDSTELANLILDMASNAYEVASGFQVEISDIDVPEFSPPDFDFGDFDFGVLEDALADIIASAPDVFTREALPSTSVEAPSLPAEPSLAIIDVPNFDADVPDLDFRTAPEWQDYSEPAEPSVESITAPDEPSITMPTVPTLSDVEIPSAPGLDLPTFDKSLIDEELLEPSNTFSFNEPEYSSALKSALDSGLYDMVANGNYGLDTEDEQRLFDRARERELQAALLLSEQATRPFNLTGFFMPTGALLNAQYAGMLEAQNKIISAEREILIKTADLHWEGKKFAYTQAVDWEKTLMNFHNSFYERMLNAAKAEVQMSIEVFRAQIERYKANQERFLAHVQVFQSLIDAEKSKVEIYRAQIEGARLNVDLNRALVERYNAEIEGVKTIVSIYATQVEAAKSVMEMERLKIDTYKAKVEAFVAKTQGQSAKFEAYKAQIQGELAKVETYKVKTQAYEAIVSGRKLAVDMNTALIEQYKATVAARVDIFNAELRAAENERSSALAAIQADVEGYRANVAAYQASSDAIVKLADVNGRWAESQYRLQMAGIELYIESAKVALETAKAQADIQVEILQAKGQIYAALASSAMSAINLNSSVSQSANFSCSESWSNNLAYSNSMSQSASVSENKNINSNINSSYEQVEYHYYEE